METSWNKKNASQGGGGVFAVTNAGPNIIGKKYWKNDEAERGQNRSVQTAEKNFRWNGGQETSENFAVIHVG